MKLEEYTKEELMEWIRVMDGKTYGLFSDLLDRWTIDKVFDEYNAAYKKSIDKFKEFAEKTKAAAAGEYVIYEGELDELAEEIHAANLDLEEKWKQLQRFTQSEREEAKELLRK